MATAKLTVTPLGKNEHVEVNGVDVAPGCRGYTLRAEVGEMPTLTLDLPLLEGAEVDGDVQVLIPEATRQTLIALGWTPPDTVPAYVYALLDAYQTGEPLDFGGHPVPADVTHWLEATQK